MNLISSNPDRVDSPFMLRPNRLAWTSLVIAAAAIASSLLVGWLAYTTSRRAILDSVARENLSIGRTIINHVEHKLGAGDRGITNQEDPDKAKQDTIVQISMIWNRTDPPYPGSYVCVIEPGGKLALHTKNPGMCGTDVSQVIVDPDSSRPRNVSELLESRQSLATRNVNFRGNSQLVGYAYMPSIDSLVVVHVPSQQVEDKIRKAGIPWMIALALVGGVLIPLSVGLIHHGYLKSLKVNLQVSETLIASEQQLKRQFAELELLYRTAPVGLCLVDVDLRFVRINDELAALHGRPADEHVGRTLREVVPDLADFIEPIYQRVIATGEPELKFDVERVDRTNLSERLNYLASVFPMKDDKDRVIGVSTVVQDISDRKRVAEKLQFTQFSVDSCSMSIFWLRDDASFFYVNEAATQSFGYSRDELLSMTVHDIDPQYTADVWPKYWREMQRKRTLKFESQIKHKDGTLIPVEITTNLLDFRGQEFMFAFVTNISERLRSEKKHQESELLFRTMFEQAAVGVAQLDSVKGNILRINRRCCEILSSPEKELVGKTWMELTHPDDLQSDLAIMQRLLSGQIRNFALEKRLQLHDGASVWINLAVSAMWEPGEEPSTLIAIVEDITERKESELALRQSEELFRRLVRVASFGVQRNDLDGKITFANQALGQIYGASPEEMIGKYVWDFAVDDQARRAMQRYLRRRVTSSPSEPTGFDTKNRTCDGRIIDVFINWTFDLDPEGNVVGFIVVVADITKRKEFERTLEFQADVLNRVSDAVLVSDSAGVVTYANEAAEQLFRDRQLEFKGRKLSQLHDALRVSGPTSEDIRTGFDETGTWQGENEFQINHEARSFETNLKRFQASGSDDRFIVSVVRDISQRKQAEQERRQQRDALAHMTRLSTMGELVAGIAHEVKQPLHAISNYANAASISLAGVDPNHPLRSDQIDVLKECNAGIREASTRANEIIQGLRAFAQKSEKRREKININQVINHSIELVAFEARQSRTTVQTVFAEGLPDVMADRIQIEQVVVNLLHNAYEALRKCDQPRHVIVRTLRSSRDVEIQVEDNGPGIPSDQYGRLFEAFYTTKNDGMGMGLAISRTIVEDHDGRLWAANNSDAGVTFNFSLPVVGDGADQSKE